MNPLFKSAQKRLTINLLRRFYGNRPERGVAPETLDSIALFAQERFGDIIMMSPLIRGLKRAFPDCKIDIISVNQIADYLKHDKNINRVLKAKHPAKEVKNYLHKHQFDLLFNTKDHPSVIFLYLTGTIKARQRIGLSHQEHRGFFNHLLTPPATGTTVQKYLSLLDFMNIHYTEKELCPLSSRRTSLGRNSRICQKRQQSVSNSDQSQCIADIQDMAKAKVVGIPVRDNRACIYPVNAGAGSRKKKNLRTVLSIYSPHPRLKTFLRPAT